jgi:hypothetical protein
MLELCKRVNVRDRRIVAGITESRAEHSRISFHGLPIIEWGQRGEQPLPQSGLVGNCNRELVTVLTISDRHVSGGRCCVGVGRPCLLHELPASYLAWELIGYCSR